MAAQDRKRRSGNKVRAGDNVKISVSPPTGTWLPRATLRRTDAGEGGSGRRQPPPPPQVLVPDVALELWISALDQDRVRQLRDTFNASSGTGGDLRVLYVDDAERIGIWFFTPPGQLSPDKDAGLYALDLLTAGEKGLLMGRVSAHGTKAFAVFINSAFLRTEAARAFAAQPKVLDENGNASADGPVHLTGFQIQFQSPDTVASQLDGFYDSAWPDASFKVVERDTFSISQDQWLSCADLLTLQTDPSTYNLLAALAAPVSPLSLFFAIEAAVLQYVAGPVQGGIGCQVLPLIPRKIGVPRGFLVPSFVGVRVGNGGIVAWGDYDTFVATARVMIVGRTKLTALEGLDATALYGFHAERLWRFPIESIASRHSYNVEWSVTGGTVSRPTAEYTLITFDTADLNVGETVTRSIDLSVRDWYGVEATDQAEVEITIVRQPPPRPRP